MVRDVDVDVEIQGLINQLRARRWSDEAIARELGVSGATVHRWRHGKQGVHLPRLVQAALAGLLERP